MTAKKPSRLRMPSEGTRAWLSMIPSMIATFIGSTITYRFFETRGDEFGYLATLWGWSSYAITHSLLTWATFRGRRGTDLDLMLAADERSRSGGRGLWRFRLVRWLTGGDSAPSWSVQVSAMALIGTGVLLVNSSLRTPALLISSGLLVIASWVNVWITFSVQYARADRTHGGFEFPGEGPRDFSDYVYVALAGQTTFGTTDVAITNTRMRKLSMNHSLIAFAFNSVILAMIVSLILSGVSGR